MADTADAVPEPGRVDNPDSDPRVKQLRAWVTARKSHWKERFKEVRRARQRARGRIGSDAAPEGGRQARANLIHGAIQALMPLIYARNPDIDVSIAESVDEQRYAGLDMFGRTLEVVLNREFVKACELKKRAKRAVRASLTSRIGWAKLTYQRAFSSDPVVIDRIRDCQADIEHLGSLRAKLADDERSQDEIDRLSAELERIVSSLEQKSEVVIDEGLACDILPAERVILDNNIIALEDYRQCRRIAHEILLPKEEAEDRYEREFKKAEQFWVSEDGEVQGEDRLMPAGGGDANQRTPFLLFHEIWDITVRQVETICKGIDELAAESFTPEAPPKQWYPFFPLGFHIVDGFVMPLSLPELLEELQEEYDDTRTQLKEHRELMIPTWVADVGTDRDSLEREQDKVLGEVVLVDAQGRPLNEVIQRQEMPNFDPRVYDTLPIRADMDLVSGLQDANRAVVLKPKTAREADILQQGLSSRSQEMQDTIEDWIQAMAQAAAEILLQVMNPIQVMRLAGESFAWPKLPRMEIFELVDVEIRAGSSGRPDKSRDRQQWAELLPVIMALLDKYKVALMEGGDGRPERELLRMTLAKFDERLDLEQILPRPGQASPLAGLLGPGAGAAPGGTPGNVVPLNQAQGG